MAVRIKTTDYKEMLSPDVPEFVPREFQNLDASAGAQHAGHTTSSYTPQSYSQSHNYSSNHGVFNPGSWRSESVHSLSFNEKTAGLNRYRGGQIENKPFYPISNSNWRNTGKDGFNPKYSGKLRNASLKEKKNWRENASQVETVGNSRSLHQSLIRSEGDESSRKKNWRKNSSQVQSAWSKNGLDQQVAVSGSITQSAHAEFNAPQNYKQRLSPNKTDSVSQPPNAISNSTRGNRGTKVEGLVFSTQFKHEDDASYTKVLSRKNIDGALRERADTIKNDSLLHSEEQWPSLSFTQSQNSSDNCDNVWIKNNDEKQSSCSKPGLTDVTTSSASLQNMISEAKDTAYPNMNIVVNKPERHSHVTDRKDGHKNTQSYQRYDENTQERILNSKSKELEGNEMKNCKKLTENQAYSKQKDISSRMNSSHLDTVTLKQNTTNMSELKTKIPSGSSMEECTTEWQVQKKKKKKLKEQLEIAVRNSDRNNSSNKEVKINKRDDSQNKYPNIPKYDNTKKTNLGMSDKNLKNQSKSNRLDKHGHGQERVRESIQENAEKGKDNFSKSKSFEESSLPSHKSTRSNDRNVVAEVESFNSKSNDSVTVSSIALLDAPESNDSISQRSSVSLATKEHPIKDEKAKKASAEKKARIKEEKMRKRELKIKAAQAQLMADSKVTMVSKEVLEMMYRGQNQRSGKASGAVSKGKVCNTEPSQGGHVNFQFSFENYPSLQGDSKNKVTKHKESPIKDEGSVLQEPIMLGEGHYELKTKEDKDVKFQNNLTRRKVNVALSSFLSEESKGKKANTLGNHGSEGTSGTSVSDSTPSYSKALLTTASKLTGMKPTREVKNPDATRPTPKVNTISNLTPQITDKKKVKTKDEIKFNLMDAVTMKVKKKDLLNVKRQTKTINQVDFDPVTMAIKERIRNRSRILLSALDHQTSKTDARERNQKRRSLLSALDNTSKPRAEVVAKRGKQREGLKKKKLSALKKAIKRARQQEVENLLSVLQEAKKLQESLIPVDVPVMCSSPLETSEMPALEEAAEAITSNKEQENSTEIVENEDLKVAPSSDVQGPLISNKRAPDCVKYENSRASEVNTKETQSTDPDFPLKCQKILEDMEFLHNSVHKRSFREYCNHMITPEVNVAAKELISTLVAYQDRHYKRDPVKARMRRRFVCGLRSTVKAMGKMSCIIVAPDIERCKGPGALDEVVENMLKQAENHSVPVIFALTCKKIGNLCLKRVGVSCIGIINYHGAQGVFQKLMEMIPEAKAQYQQRVAHGFCSIPVGDEPPDDEPESTQESIKQIDSSEISKEATKDTSVVDEHSIREEVIASTVAILNEHSSEECVSCLENGKKLATNEAGSSLIMEFHGDREAEVVSSPTL